VWHVRSFLAIRKTMFFLENISRCHWCQEQQLRDVIGITKIITITRLLQND
jgi:hypothetical protein